MVKGLDWFRERFRKFEGAFTLIGGAACDEWFTAQGLPFRATKDLDIVLIIEVIDPSFVGALRNFISEGGYEIRQRTEDTPVLYRFSPRQQFFLVASPEHRAVGAPPVAWWLHDYFQWLGEPYYLALQSAASSLGSNPQALQMTQVMTRIPRRPLEVGRIRVQFFVKRAIEQTPTQPLANAYALLQVSTPEATAFDLIHYATRIGGIGRAAETIAPLLPLLRRAELRRVLNMADEPTTAQRLGFVLGKLRANVLAKSVENWLPADLKFVPLVPGAHQDAPEIKQWKILNNTMEFEG